MEKDNFLSLVLIIERLHRRFLDVVKVELESLDIEDVNNVQTLVLYNIGDSTITVGELTHRGYYLGSNVSYNIKKLTENGYIIQERSPHDKRSIKVKLSQKGLDLCKQIDGLFQRNIEELQEKDIDVEEIESTVANLGVLEQLWADFVKQKYAF